MACRHDDQGIIGDDGNRGVIPRAFDHVFKAVSLIKDKVMGCTGYYTAVIPHTRIIPGDIQ